MRDIDLEIITHDHYDHLDYYSIVNLKSNDYSIFNGGDSGYDDSFKSIGQQYAMLECGQYDIQWPFIHMMPEETVQASIDLNAEVLMPVHWAKFTVALHPWKEPIEISLSLLIKLENCVNLFILQRFYLSRI